jgi:hypothetical protein
VGGDKQLQVTRKWQTIGARLKGGTVKTEQWTNGLSAGPKLIGLKTDPRILGAKAD